MLLQQIIAGFLICCCCTVESASILALFSSLSFSDHLVFRNYISLLTQRGHSVVIMTPYPGQFTYPDVEKIVELNVGPESSAYWEEYKALMTNIDDYYPRMRAINDFSIKLAVAQLKSKPMTALLANPNVKFDLVITEADVPLLYAVADKYEAPHIAITASSGKIHQYESVDMAILAIYDLKVALDSATKGVVYFSLGAFQEPEHLSLALLQTFADAFRELPFLVLWKISNTTMINDLPNNVISSSWFPQQEILAHPNVKAFITNGGGRSLEEAVFYEVPIIGLPIVRSRKVFIQEITRYDAGELLDLYYLEKEELKEVITSVVSSEKYINAMSKLKSMVSDPLLSGPGNAVWWTEYILQNGGANLLRSPAVGLSYFKYFTLDIIGVLLTISIVLFSLLFCTLRIVVKRLRVRFLSKYKAL